VLVGWTWLATGMLDGGCSTHRQQDASPAVHIRQRCTPSPSSGSATLDECFKARVDLADSLSQSLDSLLSLSLYMVLAATPWVSLRPMEASEARTEVRTCCIEVQLSEREYFGRKASLVTTLVNAGSFLSTILRAREACISRHACYTIIHTYRS